MNLSILQIRAYANSLRWNRLTNLRSAIKLKTFLQHNVTPTKLS